MELSSAIFIIVCIFVLFFILRALMLWYWKVPELLDQLKEQSNNSAIIAEQARVQTQQMQLLLKSKVQKVQVLSKNTGEVKVVSIDEWLYNYSLLTDTYELAGVA